MKNVLQARDDRAKQLKTARDKSDFGALDAARRVEEKSQLQSLIGSDTVAVGDNPSGMYELCGEL